MTAYYNLNVYFSEEDKELLDWFRTRYEGRISPTIRDFIVGLKTQTENEKLADTAEKETRTTPDKTYELYQRYFKDINDDREFIDLCGSERAKNAILSRMKNIESANPGKSEEVIKIFKKKHPRLAELL